jgi:hypothetical protein
MRHEVHFNGAVDKRASHDVLGGVEGSVPDVVIIGREVKGRFKHHCLLHFYC